MISRGYGGVGKNQMNEESLYIILVLVLEAPYYCHNCVALCKDGAMVPQEGP